MHIKKVYSIVGIIILAGAVIGAAIYTKRLRLQSPIILLPQPGQVVTGSKLEMAQGLDGNGSFNSLQDVSGGTAAEAVSYEDALQAYSGHVIQFDPNCTAAPITMQLPAKSVIMFGNQSRWQRTVTLGQRTYTIAPYDYVLASFNMPATYNVSCDSLKNVAVINIQ